MCIYTIEQGRFGHDWSYRALGQSSALCKVGAATLLTCDDAEDWLRSRAVQCFQVVAWRPLVLVAGNVNRVFVLSVPDALHGGDNDELTLQDVRVLHE